MSEQLWWYVARAGGIVAWAMLAASVLWGLAISTKATKGRVRPNWMLDMHRYLGGMAVVFVGVHVAGLVLDSYVHFGPAEILAPLASTYRPGPVAWGIVAMYLLLAVELTSLARKRLSKRVWRITHGLAFPVFAFSTVHGLLAGTDGSGSWLRGVMLATSVVVGVLTLQRIVMVARRPDEPRRPLPRPAAHPGTGPTAAEVPAAEDGRRTAWALEAPIAPTLDAPLDPDREPVTTGA